MRNPIMAKVMIRLTFPEAFIKDPVIYRLGHDFQVVTNIYRASVEKNNAWVLLELEGEKEEIQRSIEFLKNWGIGVEEQPEIEI